MSSESFFHAWFKSPTEKINAAISAKDDDLVWRYLKQYSHVIENDTRAKMWHVLSVSAGKLKCCPDFEHEIRLSPNYRTLTNDMERTWILDDDDTSANEKEKEEGKDDEMCDESDKEEDWLSVSPSLISLRNDLKLILISFWKRNKRVSYCQGLHSICNMIYHEMNGDVNGTLSVLNTMVEELCVGGLYIHEPPLTALQHCADLIFDDYLCMADGALYEALDKLDFVNILAHWFMSGFVGVLDRCVVIQLFDRLISDGIICFFAAAIMILKMKRNEILSKSRDLKKDPSSVGESLLLSLGLGSKCEFFGNDQYLMKMVDKIQSELLVDHNFDEKLETPLFHDHGLRRQTLTTTTTSEVGMMTSDMNAEARELNDDDDESVNTMIVNGNVNAMKLGMNLECDLHRDDGRNRSSSDVSEWSMAEEWSAPPPNVDEHEIEIENENVIEKSTEKKKEKEKEEEDEYGDVEEEFVVFLEDISEERDGEQNENEDENEEENKELRDESFHPRPSLFAWLFSKRSNDSDPSTNVADERYDETTLELSDMHSKEP